jgi:hypothetical protein
MVTIGDLAAAALGVSIAAGLVFAAWCLGVLLADAVWAARRVVRRWRQNGR